MALSRELYRKLDRSIRQHQAHRARCRSKHPPVQMLIVAICVTVVGVLVVVTFIALLWLHRRKRLNLQQPPSGDLGARKLRRFSYRELKRATSKFSDSRRLGKGGFGVVYQGVLKNGQQVAVKKLLLSSLQGEREFQNELSICSRLNSKYVVKLLGFSSHGEKMRLLVYECMQNRSLQEALLEKKDPAQCLDWATRYNIILDIAKALAYLHLECDPPVIHGDIKPSNVLLDEKYSAYLADFGLAKVKILKDAAMGGGRQGTPDVSERFRSDTSDQYIHVPGTPDSHGGGKRKSFDPGMVENGFRKDLVENGCSRDPKQVRKVNVMADQQHVAQQGSVDLETSLPSSYIGSPHSALQGTNTEGAHVEHETVVCPIASALHHDDASQVHQQEEEGKKEAAEKKAFGKDWWWKQENSGELKVRDYVMEWMKTELAMSIEGRIEDEQQQQQQHQQQHQQQQQQQQQDLEKKRLKKEKNTLKKKVMEDMQQQETRKKSRARNRRKSREWWKDEYFAELNEKRGSGSRDVLSTVPVVTTLRPAFNSNASGLSDRWRSQEYPEGGVSEDFSHEVSSTTSLRGTVCYVAPESGGAGLDSISEASDIYSFGVLLLVIISGRRPIDITTTDTHFSTTTASTAARRFERGNLITWARALAYSGNILDLVDEHLVDYVRDQVQLCINMALLCLRRVPSRRPTISDLLKALEGETSVPCLPFEFSPSPQNTCCQYSPLPTLSLVSNDGIL